MVMGMIESGVPLGVTFSFLISSPTVNEVALVLLIGLYGAAIAGIYIGTGLFIAIVAGIIIGKLHMEKYLEFQYDEEAAAGLESVKPSWGERLRGALSYTGSILKKVWLYVVIGVAVGAAIHGWVPQSFILKVAGPHNPFAVPIAVIIGIPMYANAAGVIPIIQALTSKGLPMGTALAFMMSVIGLSLPALIILRKVMKVRLLAVFVGIMFVSFTIVGYIFNALIH
jgi:uncharacterized membrane protein YraQ (UPF0718 family)